MSKLAILGGPAAVRADLGDTFAWPIVTPEHEEAVLQVLRRGAMSGLDVTMEFERAYAQELGMKHALAFNNGTSAIHGALFGLGVGVGDEVLCPSLTYWASVLQLYSLGATPVFADVDPETLCLDPADVARRVTPRTKAIIVVHYAGMMADMDAIMALAKQHKLKVFEDCSHAHFCLHKGKQAGTFGDASGFSLMSGKSFAIGEAGIMFTNDREILERAILFGHYERHGSLALESTKTFAGLPCGGYKHRIHQLSSAFGLVQLKHYRRQFAEIDQAMNQLCDLLDDLPGVKPIRPAKGSGSTKGGWYFPLSHYRPEQLGGLSVGRFVEALRAEGVKGVSPGCNKPLHPPSAAQHHGRLRPWAPDPRGQPARRDDGNRHPGAVADHRENQLPLPRPPLVPPQPPRADRGVRRGVPESGGEPPGPPAGRHQHPGGGRLQQHLQEAMTSEVCASRYAPAAAAALAQASGEKMSSFLKDRPHELDRRQEKPKGQAGFRINDTGTVSRSRKSTFHGDEPTIFAIG